MKFKQWINENTSVPFRIPIAKLYGWKPKVIEAVGEVYANKLSFNSGSPVTVSRLDNPRGAFFMIDGYHRVLEAMMAGQKDIMGTIDQFTPRIERTGGAHAGTVADKVMMSQAFQLAPKPNPGPAALE